MKKNYVRMAVGSLVWAAMTCTVAGCAVEGPANSDEMTSLGQLKMPLRAVAGEHTYVLTNVGLYVTPTYQWFGANEGDRSLSIELVPGDYTASLESFTLNRELQGGALLPVEAQLVTDQRVDFAIFNDATSTISFQFETDGQIVTVGTGELRVLTAVQENAPACSPLGDDCGEGLWCAPSELTGLALTCLSAGAVALGGQCASPTDCAANSTCLRFGSDQPKCVALCGSEEFGQACEAGGTCHPRGQDYGVCEPERPADAPCLDQSVLLPLSQRSESIAVDQDCMVYVASQTGEVIAHDLWTKATKVIASAGHPLSGIDLSPTGATLVSAEAAWSSSTSRKVLLLNRLDGSTSERDFLLGYYESPVVPRFLSDTQLWLSSEDIWGTSRLNQLDLASGGAQARLALNSSARFTLAEEQTSLFVAGTDGTLGVLDQASGEFRSADSGASNQEVAINPAGTVMYVASSAGLLAYETEGLSSLWSAPGNAAGVAYVPGADTLVVSWVGGIVEARDPQGGAVLSRLDSTAGIWSYGSPLSSGHLRASRGGSMVTMNDDSGVRVYSVPARAEP